MIQLQLDNKADKEISFTSVGNAGDVVIRISKTGHRSQCYILSPEKAAELVKNLVTHLNGIKYETKHIPALYPGDTNA